MAFQVIEKQVLYKGKKIDLEVHHLQDDAGKRTQREIVVHPGAVVILPFLDDKTILLIRNRRYTIQQILLELPAGTLEHGESPMNCAGRELQDGAQPRRAPGRIKVLDLGIFREKMQPILQRIFSRHRR